MLVKPLLERIRGLCGYNVLRKTIPVWYHSVIEEKFSDIQSGSFNEVLHTVSSPLKLCVI